MSIRKKLDESKRKNKFSKTPKSHKKSKMKPKKHQKDHVKMEMHQPSKVTTDNEDMLSESGSSDVEEEYEKVPRTVKSVNVKNLLPIKNKSGLVFRSHVLSDDEKDLPDAAEENDPEPQTANTFVQNYAAQKTCFKDLKRKVALLCTSLIEEPENNMAALKELITLLQNPSTKMIVSEKKVLTVSLLHVFLDILPSYRIRLQEEDKNSKVIFKKETKKLLGYEQTLLKCYKKYLDILYDLIRKMKFSISSRTLSEIRKKANYQIGFTAIKCMCELLRSRFSFNHFKDIANKLVPLSIDVDSDVSELCCRAFERMFKADKLGEASFDLVKQIIDVIKARQFCIPISLLRTFLYLNLREAKKEVEKIDMKKGRKQWQDMSRTQRKDKKKMKELEAEMKEAQAYEDVENVKKHHTATLNKIFWVFFHILKDGDKPLLVAPALEGLSKFAYLINLEFFDDLNSVLCGMMASDKLGHVEKLHGVYTLFTILAGQAESLHIDPHQIYCHMYQGLLSLGYSTDIQHLDLTLKCLEFNIHRKRNKISFNRILAFIKRVSTVSLHTPVHATLGLTATLRNLLKNVKGADILLDSENSVGSGFYLPEIEDPEHCNPQSTALFELHLLRLHYNPAVKHYSMHLLNNCAEHGRLGLPPKLANLSPEDTLQLFADVAVNNKMDFIENVEEPPKKKIKFNSSAVNFSFEENTDLNITQKSLEKIKF